MPQCALGRDPLSKVEGEFNIEDGVGQLSEPNDVAQAGYPKFCNDDAVPEIRIGVKEFN